MNNTLAIVSLEKEVGKSTLALNLAHSFSKHLSHNIFLLDLDFHNGSLTKMLKLENLPASMHDLVTKDQSPLLSSYKHPHGFYFIPNFAQSKNYSSHLLNHNLKKIKKENNLILLDSNSGKGMLGSLEAADDFIIVSSFSKPSFNTLVEMSNIIENNNKTVLGVVFNKVKNLPNKSALEHLELFINKKILSVIPEHKLIHHAALKSQPATYLYPYSSPAVAMHNLSKKLSELYPLQHVATISAQNKIVHKK